MFTLYKKPFVDYYHGKYLVIDDHGTYYPAYLRDLTGNIIFQVSSPEEGLFSHNAYPLVFANEMNYPLPWHLSYEEFLGWFEKTVFKHGGMDNNRLCEAYPELAIPEVKEIFFPIIEGAEANENKIWLLIDKHKECQDQSEKASIEKFLSEYGVFRIPSLNLFNPTYHAPVNQPGNSVTYKVTEEGWVYNRKIIKKSTIQFI